MIRAALCLSLFASLLSVPHAPEPEAGPPATLCPVQVSRGVWRGPKPESVADVRLLARLGVRTILTLQDREEQDPAELRWAARCGLRVVQVPCSQITPPKYSQVRSALWVLRDRGPVYVHCRYGVDRTGVVVLAYRCVCEGWDFEAARQEMFERGFHRALLWWGPAIRATVERVRNADSE